MGVGHRPADNDNTVTLPDYVRTDVALYYQPWKHLDLALNIKNLFNIDYIETLLSAIHSPGSVPVRPSVFRGRSRPDIEVCQAMGAETTWLAVAIA